MTKDFELSSIPSSSASETYGSGGSRYLTLLCFPNSVRCEFMNERRS